MAIGNNLEVSFIDGLSYLQLTRGGIYSSESPESDMI